MSSPAANPTPPAAAAPGAAAAIAAAAIAAARRRRLLPWRIVLLAYSVVLVTGLGWPRLGLGPEVPGTDKTVHLVAFATLFVLVHRAGFAALRGARRPVVATALVVILAAWATEAMQAMPGLGRTATAADLAANAMGVAIAAAWTWALAPVGGPMNRRRLALSQLAFDEAFARRGPWIAAVLVLASAILVVAATWIWTRRVGGDPRIVRWTMIGAIVVAGHAAALVMMRVWTRETSAVIERRTCADCGAACIAAPGDDLACICPRCGARTSIAFWRDRPPRSSTVARGDVVRAAAVLAGLFVVIVAAAFALPYLHRALLTSYDQTGVAARIANWMARVPEALADAADVTLGAAAAACAVRFYRGRLARFHDEGQRCGGCGFALQGLPVRADETRCPECGRLAGAVDPDPEPAHDAGGDAADGPVSA